MSRRITTGEVGGAVGGLNVTNTTLTTADNVDIIVNPRGVGRFVIQGNAQLQSQGDLRFGDADSSNYVGFQAPATVSSNVLWTLPATDGSNNQLLTTNGSGILSFSTASVSIVDNTTDAAQHYPTFTTATSGVITQARVSSTKLQYQPSTGSLRLLGNTASSSTTTGTLIVTGGMGISAAVFIGGNVDVAGSLTVGAIAGVSGYVLQNAGATLLDIDRKYVVANTAGITLTLPNTSIDGRTITIVDGNNFASFNVTLGRGTRTIDGLAENLVLNVAKSKVELVYRGGDWKVFVV